MTDPVTPNPLACTVDDVAAWIRSRTKDSNGNELGTFTDDTRPTAAQVEEAIGDAVVLLHKRVGVIGPGMCTSLAQGVVAIGAAYQIEVSYFAEQARRDMSPLPYLATQYDEALQGLYDCVAGNLPDSPDPDDPDAQSVRFGTLDCISGTVSGYYTGRHWPPLPNPPPVVDNG